MVTRPSLFPRGSSTFSHHVFTEEEVLAGAPRLHFVRSLALFDGMDRGTEPPKGQPVLVPAIKTDPRVLWEPLEPLWKKHMKRQEKNITADPESGPFLGADWEKDTGAFAYEKVGR